MGGSTAVPHYGIGNFPKKANKGSMVWNDTTGALPGLYIGDGTLWNQVLLTNVAYLNSGGPSLVIDRGTGLPNIANSYQPAILFTGQSDVPAGKWRLYFNRAENGFSLFYNTQYNENTNATDAGRDVAGQPAINFRIDTFEGAGSFIEWRFSDSTGTTTASNPNWSGAGSYHLFCGRNDGVTPFVPVAAALDIVGAGGMTAEIRFAANDTVDPNRISIGAYGLNPANKKFVIRSFTTKYPAAPLFDYGYSADRLALDMTTGDLSLLGNLVTAVVATASLPVAGAAQNGKFIIEDAGAGNRNLIIYAGGERFRIDGGANV